MTRGWLTQQQRQLVMQRRLREYRYFIVRSGLPGARNPLASHEAEIGSVLVRNLLVLRARGRPDLPVLARAHWRAERDRPCYSEIIRLLRARENNPRDAAARAALGSVRLASDIPSLVVLLWNNG